MPTFAEVARDHLAIQRLAPATLKNQRWLLEHLKPIHHVDVDDLTAPILLAPLRGIEQQGKHATAHAACGLAGAVLRYALAAGLRTKPDVAAGIKRILVPVQTTNTAAITDPLKFGHLLAALDTLTPGAVRDALTIAPHVFVRPHELRGMRWSEIEWGLAEWRIPAGRMKMRRPFTKFLSGPVVEMLQAIRAGQNSEVAARGFVFPGRQRGCISENIMGMALGRLFYSPEEMTPHGFRVSASTMLADAGHEPHVIEAALAHARGKVEGIYNRARYADAQRALHESWSRMVLEMKASAAS